MTREELNKIAGLLNYLNDSFGHEFDAEVVVTDSNGTREGKIVWQEWTDTEPSYVFMPTGWAGADS